MGERKGEKKEGQISVLGSMKLLRQQSHQAGGGLSLWILALYCLRCSKTSQRCSRWLHLAQKTQPPFNILTLALRTTTSSKWGSPLRSPPPEMCNHPCWYYMHAHWRAQHLDSRAGSHMQRPYAFPCVISFALWLFHTLMVTVHTCISSLLL